MVNRALSTSQRAGCCAKVDDMPTNIQTVTRANARRRVSPSEPPCCVPRDLAIVLGPWSRQKLVNVLNHLSRGDATTVPPREQSFCLAASYLEERSRSWEIGTGGQALRSKPLVSCGMATRATVPACHVEL